MRSSSPVSIRLIPPLLLMVALIFVLWPGSLLAAGPSGKGHKWTPTPTVAPTSTVAPAPTFTDTPTPTLTSGTKATSTPEPTSTGTAPAPTATTPANETPTPTPTLIPGPTDTPGPTNTPTTAPTPTPTPVPTATPTMVPGENSMAVAYQVDVAHDGSMQGATINTPLARKWSVNFGQPVSYPLIAGGKVFITVSDYPSYGTRLYALDSTTGGTLWGPVDLGGTYFWSGIAYDDGRVFAVNYNGLMRAFDATSGQLLWQTQLSQTSFTSPPTALQGIVYVGGAGSGGTLYALDAVTGTLLWSKPVANGDNSSPALSSDGVFVSYTCPHVYKFDRSTGALLWAYGSNSCSGGGGRTSVYSGQNLYVRDPISTGYVFDAQSGSQVGSFNAGPAPAFYNGLGYYLFQGTLTATNLQGTAAWTFSGDGTLSSAPLIVGSVVFVGGTSGNLYALEAATGHQLWTDKLPAGIPAPDEQNVSQPLTGLNSGEGLLVVPAGNVLVAYGQ